MPIKATTLFAEYSEAMKLSQTHTMLDIVRPLGPVEVGIREDGKVLWVNIEGTCVLRICQISSLSLSDSRPAGEGADLSGKEPSDV